MNEIAASTVAAPKTRVAAPELLRFVAASVVCYVHFEEFTGVEDALFRMGYIFVEMFLMLTGFYMMLGAFKREGEPVTTGEAFMNAFRKAKSIYFPYFLALVFAFVAKIICERLSAADAATALFHYKWEFFFLQMLGFNPNPQFGADYLLGSGWYLSAMFIALIPAYYLARKHTRVFAGVIAPLAAAAIYCFEINFYGTLSTGNEVLYFIMMGTVRAFAGICAGAFAAYVFKRLKALTFTKKLRVGLSLAEILCCALVVGTVFLRSFLTDADMIMYIFVLGLLIITFNLNQTWVSEALNTHGAKLWLYLGRLSLYMYLFHWYIVNLWGTYLFKYNGTLAYIVYFLNALLVAFLVMKLDDWRKKRKALRAVG